MDLPESALLNYGSRQLARLSTSANHKSVEHNREERSETKSYRRALHQHALESVTVED